MNKIDIQPEHVFCLQPIYILRKGEAYANSI